MWLNGLILVTVLTAAKSAEAELNVEAAFQGHCGHTSPCEQLCYEIHDGMYECDCIEGYELNKNGYSCQVINSTLPPEGPTKSEEDVLYQKGASFSAKLANGVNGSNQVLISGENDNETEDDDDFIADIDDNSSHRKSNSYIDSNNSKDYYISSDSISFNDDQLDLNPVPEFKHTNSLTKNYSNRLDMFPDSVSRELDERMEWLRQQPDQQQGLNDTSKATSVASESAPATPDSSAINGNTFDDDYYSRQDMSVYDDVNNNKLNLRPIDANTYQNEYNQLPATSSTSTTSTTKEPNGLSNENISERRDTIETGNTSQASSTHKGPTEALHFNLSTEMRFNSSNYNSSSSSSNRTGVESCSLDCGLDGVCETNEDGIPRCLCSFGKSGNGCLDDTKVRIPRFAKKSWLAFPALRGAYKHVQIRVEFRPESIDGIILLTGERDDLTGDFMALLIHQGYIEFWFDCGSGVGSVRSEEKVRLNEWNSVTIYRHRWDAWLLLNHGTRVQGRSKGLFSRITFREPVFLGGTGNITGLAKRLPVFEGMVGCIRRFVANEHEYSFNEHPLGDVSKGFDIQDCAMDKCYKYPCQHEGKCLPSDQGAICLCPMGFVGDLCELRLDLQVPSFNGSSYLRYAPLGDSALIWLELQVIIKPEDENGIILYTGHDHHGDFIALSLDMGFVEFSFDLGSGPAIVRSDYPITTGQWHTIKVSRTARLAVLKVDQLPEVMTISSNGFWHLSLPHNLYLGGVPHSDYLPTPVRHRGFFTGCIQKVKINSRSMSIVGEALGGTNVDNCPHACNNQPCGPLAECVPLLETYECRCGIFSPECNKTSNIPMHASSATRSEFKTKSTATTYNTHSLPTGNNQQHHQHNKLHSKHSKSHYPQRQAAQFSSSNSIDSPSHKSNPKRNRKAAKLAATTRKPISDGAKLSEHITPEMFYLGTESRDAPTVDLYVDDNTISSHDFHIPFGRHTETPHQKDFQFDENNLQLDMSVKQFSPEELNPHHPYRVPVSVSAAGVKSHKRQGKKHQRILYKSDYEEVNEKGHYDGGDNDDQNTEIFEADSDDLEYVPATGRTRKRLHKRPAHRWKYHKKHNKYHAERRPLHEPPSTRSQPEDGLVIVDDDVEDYHTKELFQDMKRIMKNRDNALSTISTDTLESGTGANYEPIPDQQQEQEQEQEPVIKKSLGACFTGTDSYFHYNDAETMSQIISYKIDLNLRIKTHSKNGVILWSGRQSALDTDDYLSLGIENGYLHFRYNLGSGEANVQYNATKLSDGLWHRVRAIRNSQEGFLEVDGRKSVMQRSPGKLRQLNTDTGLYVGGMTDVAYFTRRRYTTGMVGCISEIVLAGELKLNFDPATLGTAHNVETGIL